MSARPYLSHSIDQLEQLVETTNADSKLVVAIRHELSFRSSARARQLSERLDSAKPASPKISSIRTSRQESESSGRYGNRNKATAEQDDAIGAFSRGGTLKINAYAGTGKTSTLQMLAHSTKRRGQYVAFNRNIVDDARTKFPETVNCSTLHGLAYRAAPSEFRAQESKLIGSINANQLAGILGITKNWRIDENHTLQPRSQAYLILETVRRFSQSAEAQPLESHVPRHGSLVAAEAETLRAVAEFAVRGAQHVWAKMLTPEDPLPLGHDGYLKLWALSEPQIAADYILLDEAQDTNPVVLSTLRNQPAQMVYVGDRYQQIYEWRGAVNAMEQIETDSTTLLTKSFRFGDAIATAASQALSVLGERATITGNDRMLSRICETDPRAILARTNASAIAALIQAIDAGKKPHLVGGIRELMELLRGVEELKRGHPSDVPEFFGFSTWSDVVGFAKSGEGANLLTFVNLVESRGERQLMWALRQSVDENESDLIISTAHKAKGREWQRVRLMDDFLRSQKGTDPQKFKATGGLDPAEVRLFYVAMTRAREELEIPPPLAQRFGIRLDSSSPKIQTSRPNPNTEEQAYRPRPTSSTSWKPPTDWQPVDTNSARPVPQPEKKDGFLKWLLG